MINLLILTSWYPDSHNKYNGIFIRRQAIALSDICNVTIVSFKNDISKFNLVGGVFHKNVVNDRLTEVIISVPKSLPFFNQVNYLFTSIFFIVKVLSVRKFDIIHAHVSYPGGIVAYILSRLYNKPFVITEHTSPFENVFRSYMHKKLALFAIQRSNVTIAVSQGSMQNIRMHTTANIIVISNSVNLTNFNVPVLPRQGDEIVIGFLGGLNTSQKGLDILLEAVANLNSNKIVLNIGGDGERKKDYVIYAEKLGIRKFCNFLGELDPDEVGIFMSKIDFFVLASRHESFGIVLLEAMIMGKPVIATRCGGPEYFVTMETGLLAEVCNVEDLARKIEEMLVSYKKYDSDSIINYALGNFGAEIIAKKIAKLYNSILLND